MFVLYLLPLFYHFLTILYLRLFTLNLSEVIDMIDVGNELTPEGGSWWLQLNEEKHKSKYIVQFLRKTFTLQAVTQTVFSSLKVNQSQCRNLSCNSVVYS